MTHEASHFSVEQIPFSYCGSWFNLSPVIGKQPPAQDVHLVSHRGGMHAVLRLVPMRSRRRIDTELVGTPASLRWAAGDTSIEAVYERADVLRIRGRGLGLAVVAAAVDLTPFSGSYFYRDAQAVNSFVFTSYETGHRYRVTQLDGDTAFAFGLQALGGASRGIELDDGRDWQIVIEEFRTSRQPYVAGASFDDAVQSAAGTFAQFASVATCRTGSDAVSAEQGGVPLVVDDGHRTRFSDSTVDIDVQALDGQGLELGPLLQRYRAGRVPP